MLITLASELQSKFKAGLQICGENKDGELEWLGDWSGVVAEHEMCVHCGEYAGTERDWEGKPMCKFCRDIELERVPLRSYNMMK